MGAPTQRQIEQKCRDHDASSRKSIDAESCYQANTVKCGLSLKSGTTNNAVDNIITR